MYNVTPPGAVTPLVEHLPGVAAGAAFTQAAIGTVFPTIGPGFVAAAIFFFAFTCLMAYYYIAETTMVYLRESLGLPLKSLFLKIIFLCIVFFGSIQTANIMWGLGDIGFGAMCYLNLIIIVLLSRPAMKVLKDYERQKKSGIDPVFDPRNCGIENADFWIDRHK